MLLAAALVAVVTALADDASASYLPGWAQSVANTFCRNVQAGQEPRLSMQRAITQHKVSLLSPAGADIDATGRTVLFAVMERCPAALEALESAAKRSLTAPRGGSAARPGASGGCSSYILVAGRRQCL